MDERIRLMTLVWDCLEMDLEHAEVAVLLNVARWATEVGKPIPAPRNRIANQSRLSPTRVDSAMRQLMKKGYLERVKEHTATKASEYILNEKRLRGEE